MVTLTKVWYAERSLIRIKNAPGQQSRSLMENSFENPSLTHESSNILRHAIINYVTSLTWQLRISPTGSSNIFRGYFEGLGYDENAPLSSTYLVTRDLWSIESNEKSRTEERRKKETRSSRAVLPPLPISLALICIKYIHLNQCEFLFWHKLEEIRRDTLVGQDASVFWSNFRRIDFFWNDPCWLFLEVLRCSMSNDFPI